MPPGGMDLVGAGESGLQPDVERGFRERRSDARPAALRTSSAGLPGAAGSKVLKPAMVT